MPTEYSRTWPNRLPIWLLKLLINIYPPYLGTGIRIKTIKPDFRQVEVVMNMHWYNKNYVGTHFGGSIFAMTDPFHMLMLMRNLGPDYIVWDKAALIEFKKPGRGTLKATFIYTEEDIQAIRDQADANQKYIVDRSVDITDENNVNVATMTKTLYIRRRR